MILTFVVEDIFVCSNKGLNSLGWLRWAWLTIAILGLKAHTPREI